MIFRLLSCPSYVLGFRFDLAVFLNSMPLSGQLIKSLLALLKFGFPRRVGVAVLAHHTLMRIQERQKCLRDD
jgi:hypothetical protein